MVKLHQGSRAPSETSQQDFGFRQSVDYQTALNRSQDYLLSIQHPDGYWVGELIVDATLVADMVAYYYWDDMVDPVWMKKAEKHIIDRQLSDGGWNIYPGGTG